MGNRTAHNPLCSKQPNWTQTRRQPFFPPLCLLLCLPPAESNCFCYVSFHLIVDLAEYKTMLVSVSYVVELMSYVTLNSSSPPASLARLIGKIGDVTIAELRSMIQTGDMSTSQLTSPCVKYKQSLQLTFCQLLEIQVRVNGLSSCVRGLFLTFIVTSFWMSNHVAKDPVGAGNFRKTHFYYSAVTAGFLFLFIIDYW